MNWILRLILDASTRGLEMKVGASNAALCRTSATLRVVQEVPKSARGTVNRDRVIHDRKMCRRKGNVEALFKIRFLNWIEGRRFESRWFASGRSGMSRSGGVVHELDSEGALRGSDSWFGDESRAFECSVVPGMSNSMELFATWIPSLL